MRLLLALLPALLTLSVAAQTPGNMTASALALTVDSSTSPGEDEILIKGTGDASGAPIPYPAGPPAGLPLPDYRLSAMFPADVRAWIEIDAFSTGNDIIPVDQDGRIDPAQTGGWVMLSFSLAHDPVGPQGLPDSVIRDRWQSTASHLIGNDIFARYWEVEGQNLIAPSLKIQTVLEQTGEHIGLTSADELEGFDFQLPMIVTELGQPSPPFIQSTNAFYFSISSASAIDLANDPTASNYFPTGSLSGATIFRIQWNVTLAKWGSPTVRFWPTDFQLDPVDPHDDVDALAHDEFGATIISTAGPDDLLLAHTAPAFGGLVRALKGPNPDEEDIKVTLGVRAVDSIDGICGSDPDAMVFGRVMPTPVDRATLSGAFSSRAMCLSVFPSHQPADIVLGLVPTHLTIILDGFGDHGARSGWIELHQWDENLNFLQSPAMRRSSLQKRLQFPEVPSPVGRFAMSMHFYDAVNQSDYSWASVLER